MVFAEAAAFGLPSITNDVGGTSDVVIDRESGFVLNPQSGPDDYADAIEALINDDQGGLWVGINYPSWLGSGQTHDVKYDLAYLDNRGKWLVVGNNDVEGTRVRIGGRTYFTQFSSIFFLFFYRLCFSFSNYPVASFVSTILYTFVSYC